MGRFWIEGLRTDSLYLFDWTFMGEPIRVSQALSLVMILVSAAVLFYQIRIRHASRADLMVNQLAAASKAAESAGTPDGETGASPETEGGSEGSAPPAPETEGGSETAAAEAAAPAEEPPSEP